MAIPKIVAEIAGIAIAIRHQLDTLAVFLAVQKIAAITAGDPALLNYFDLAIAIRPAIFTATVVNAQGQFRIENLAGLL